MFERELEAYRKKFQELARDHAGRYALIYGDEVASAWDTYRDAMQAGYERYGVGTQFMVKQIDATDGMRVLDFRWRTLACPS